MGDMYFFPCPICSGKCFPADGLKCLNCDSTTGNIMNDNFQQKQPEIAVSGETNASSGSRILLEQNSMTLITTDLVPNRKRNKSNDQIIKKAIQPYEQDIEKIRKKTDRNRHLMQETRAATNRMPPGNRHSIDIRKPFLNNESLWNIGKFQAFQKNNAQVKILEPKESLGESVLSWDDTFAIPGPSGFHESQNVPQLLVQELNFSNTSEIPPTFLRKSLEIFPCDICSEDIDKHIKIIPRRNVYSCCACKYETDKTANLQVHIQIHCANNDCSVCSKVYADGASHVGQYICKLCQKTFQCRTEFDEHLLGHDDYFRLNCWGCCSSLSEHSAIRKGEKMYFCCMCGYYNKKRSALLHHNENHRPKICCKISREEYPEREKGFHDSKYACFKCTKEFKCRTQLEDHYKEDHVVYFSDHCRLCNRTIDNHAIEREGKRYFKCCFCEEPNEFDHYYELKNHQCEHPGLGLFKCDICGERLGTNKKLSYHKITCIRHDFKCKVCRARFPRHDSLNKHISEKHGQI